MTVKVFVGTSPNGEDDVAEKTLEYSLKKHSSEPVECIFMRNNNDPDNIFGNFDNKTWATPFTGLRWIIPYACNFQGRAIYMDVDQINFHDIADMWNIDLQGKIFGAVNNRACVMLIDCEKFQSIAKPLEQLKKSNSFQHEYYNILRNSNNTKQIDSRWNVLDGRGYENNPEEIWHLHFTSMPTQPWKPKWFRGTPRPHPRKDLVALWEKYRDEAFQVSSL